jgi:hypothetical protein
LGQLTEDRINNPFPQDDVPEEHIKHFDSIIIPDELVE